MSKTAKKEKSELEHLRGQIRTLKSQLRQERKVNKELTKKSHFFEEVVDEIEESVILKDACSVCGKGVVEEIDLKFIIVKKCQHCGSSETRKA